MSIFERLKAGLLLLLAVLGLAMAWASSAQSAGKDFYQFWVVGQSLNRPGINIYADETRDRLGGEFLEKAEASANPRLLVVAQYRRVLQTYSTPFLYAVFRVFSTGNYDVDLRNYRLLMLGSLVFGIVVLCRLLNYPWEIAPAVIAVLAIWFDPLASDLFVGNVNCFQFAAIAGYLLAARRAPSRHRFIVGGALLGMAVAFKPNLVFVPGLLAIHWIFRGRIRCLLLHAAGAGAGVAVAVCFSGMSFHNLRCWSEWMSALLAMPNDIIPVSMGNSSPVALIYESFGLRAAFPFTALLIGSSLVMVWHRRSGATEDNGSVAAKEFSDLYAISLGCLLVVIATRLAWFHYYVLAIPAFLFLLQPTASPTSGARSVVSRSLPILAFACLTPLSSMAPALLSNQQAVLAAGAALLLFISFGFFPMVSNPAISGVKS